MISKLSGLIGTKHHCPECGGTAEAMELTAARPVYVQAIGEMPGVRFRRGPCVALACGFCDWVRELRLVGSTVELL